MEPAKKSTHKSGKSTTATQKKGKGFTDEERDAMREHVQEMKAASRRGRPADKAVGESAVLAKLAALPQPDRAIGDTRRSASATRRASTMAPWPTAFALKELTADEEAKICALIKKAVS